MTFEPHLDVDARRTLLSAECARVASLSESDLDAPVPAMPEWTVDKLVRHLTFVHRMAVRALDTPASLGMSEVIAGVAKPERGPRVLDDYRQAAAEMAKAYERVDPSSEVATFLGVSTADFWIRRQLHEITVHRFDIQDGLHARGGPVPDAADAAAAADGIAEWAQACLPRIPMDRLAAVAGRTVHLHTDDGTAMELFLDFTGNAVRVEEEHRKGDVALRGSAQDMLLTVWRRRPLETLDIVGDRSVAHDLYDSVRI